MGQRGCENVTSAAWQALTTLAAPLLMKAFLRAAGAQYGQLLKPMHIHSIIREAGRIPVQRSTLYTLIKVFRIETHDSESGLDKADPKEFGSYHELIKLDKFKFKNPTKT